jgi:putative DNA primase/helicase
VDVEQVIQRLRRVAKRRWGWIACCPAHEDRRQSLTIRIADRTNDILLKCHANCGYDAILSAMGLNRVDCYGERGTPMGREVATYDYHDETGAVLFQVVRMEPKDFRYRRMVNGKWEWSLGNTRRVLYRLPAIIQGAGRTVLLVEGEKDADRLTTLGLIATCNPMGAGKWSDDYTLSLKNRLVVIIPDNDKPGRDHAESVYRQLLPVAQKVAVLQLEGLPEKGDVSDWLNAGGTKERLIELCKEALAKSKIEPADVKQVVNLARSLDRRSRWLAVRQLMADLEIEE